MFGDADREGDRVPAGDCAGLLMERRRCAPLTRLAIIRCALNLRPKAPVGSQSIKSTCLSACYMMGGGVLRARERRFCCRQVLRPDYVSGRAFDMWKASIAAPSTTP
eukprot:1355715-Pleurochrysis_carterae.AAC.3